MMVWDKRAERHFGNDKNHVLFSLFGLPGS